MTEREDVCGDRAAPLPVVGEHRVRAQVVAPDDSHSTSRGPVASQVGLGRRLQPFLHPGRQAIPVAIAQRAFERVEHDQRNLPREGVLQAVIGGKRFGLTATAIEGQHQLAGDSLPQRVTPNEALQLWHELGVPAERRHYEHFGPSRPLDAA